MLQLVRETLFQDLPDLFVPILLRQLFYGEMLYGFQC